MLQPDNPHTQTPTRSQVMYRQLLVTNPVGLSKKQFRTHSYIGHLGEDGTSVHLFPVCGFLLYVKGGKAVLSRASLKLHSSVPEA